MSLAEIYANELSYLKDAARAFAERHPDGAARLLEHGDDPDVERLLEGVAFLTAGLRARIDQAGAQIAHGLAELILPHFLRSLPSATIVEFTPNVKALRTCQSVAPGHPLVAREVKGTACRFQTCFPVDLWPLSVRDAVLEHHPGQPPRLLVQLSVSEQAQQILATARPLRFYIHHTDHALPATLLLWLTRHLLGVSVRCGDSPALRLPPGAVAPLRMDLNAVYPWPDTAPGGYRSVLELFSLPEKFAFFELSGLHTIALTGTTLWLAFEFASPPPLAAAIGPGTFRLHCTPAINLFDAPGEPITCSPLGRESIVRAEGTDPRHIEVYDVQSATAVGRVRGGRRAIVPFTSRPSGRSPVLTYALSRVRSPSDGNVDTYFRLVPPADAGSAPDDELVSLDLVCTNRDLPGELRAGDIHEQFPGGVFKSYVNLIDPSPPVRMALGSEALWRLLSHFALNQRGPSDADALRNLLRLYNFHAFGHAKRGVTNARQIEAIRGLQREPVTRMLRGVPLRAVRTTVELDERSFPGVGNAYLFGAVLDELFGSLIHINAASELRVVLSPSSQEYTWPIRVSS